MAIDDDTQFEIDEVSAIDDVSAKANADPAVGHVVSFVKEKFHKAEDARQSDEERWLKAYRNYRGLYGPDVQFTETEKSRVFIKVTKTKTLAAYGQIVDVLFGSAKFPLSIDPTVLPDGVAESVYFDTNPQADPSASKRAIPDTPYLIGDDGKPTPVEGITQDDLEGRLSYLKDYLAPVADKLAEGAGTTQTQITFHPSKVAAKKMEKKIM